MVAKIIKGTRPYSPWNSYYFENILKISGAALLAVSLVGCGGVKTIKQETGDSDAKQLMKIAGVKNHTEYLVDGNSPETAKIGVPESLLQKFNSSSGRHIINYMAGGIGGLVSLGILQNDAFTQYKDDYNKLNKPNFIVTFREEDYKHHENIWPVNDDFLSSYNEAYKKLGIDKEVKLVDGRYYIDGNNCSLEKRDCLLVSSGGYDFTYNLSYESFPTLLKPVNQSEKGLDLGKVRFIEFEKYDPKTDLGYIVDNTQTLKEVLAIMVQKRTNMTFYLYLPASNNNGVPVIIDESGKEHYFVKK
ncbi:hypothetical protein JCM30760_05450 [Thiomicrorhabdus hydrogeniphila]